MLIARWSVVFLGFALAASQGFAWFLNNHGPEGLSWGLGINGCCRFTQKSCAWDNQCSKRCSWGYAHYTCISVPTEAVEKTCFDRTRLIPLEKEKIEPVSQQGVDLAGTAVAAPAMPKIVVQTHSGEGDGLLEETRTNEAVSWDVSSSPPPSQQGITLGASDGGDGSGGDLTSAQLLYYFQQNNNNKHWKNNNQNGVVLPFEMPLQTIANPEPMQSTGQYILE